MGGALSEIITMVTNAMSEAAGWIPFLIAGAGLVLSLGINAVFRIIGKGRRRKRP